MQLDQTRIAIRERNILDILDLSLRVIQAHALPLLAALLVGILPLAGLNHFLLGYKLGEDWSEQTASYLWWLAVLMLWEVPLATAPATMYLGQALFVAQPSALRIAKDGWQSLPQLFLWQVILRGPLIPLVVWGIVERWNPGGMGFLGFLTSLGLMFWFVVWPYVNEVVLLERNPLRKRRAGGNSTYSRSAALHGRNFGELLLRGIVSFVVGTLLFVSLLASMDVLRSLLFEEPGLMLAMFAEQESPGAEWYSIYPALAGWMVIGYFTVVRFLSYLDLRIRAEGWEVELGMRAEAARMTRQLA